MAAGESSFAVRRAAPDFSFRHTQRWPAYDSRSVSKHDRDYLVGELRLGAGWTEIRASSLAEEWARRMLCGAEANGSAAAA
jgi:hypothetical protein